MHFTGINAFYMHKCISLKWMHFNGMNAFILHECNFFLKWNLLAWMHFIGINAFYWYQCILLFWVRRRKEEKSEKRRKMKEKKERKRKEENRKKNWRIEGKEARWKTHLMGPVYAEGPGSEPLHLNSISKERGEREERNKRKKREKKGKKILK